MTSSEEANRMKELLILLAFTFGYKSTSFRKLYNFSNDEVDNL